MAEIVVFHSALGLRPGVTAAADRLRAAGHKVHLPDYYDGEVFDDLERRLAQGAIIPPIDKPNVPVAQGTEQRTPNPI